jgi:muramoyltetrapeptide carboxypeptidase
MIKLKKGDIVDIVAPASYNSAEDLIAATGVLKSWGLIARTFIDFEAFHPYHSDEDDVRFLDFKRALLANDSKVIWCLRGGYGSQRILKHLQKIGKPKSEKLVIGYSDITSLHLFFNQSWNWKSLHGPMINSFGNKDLDKKSLLDLRKIFFEKKFKQKIKLIPLNDLATNYKSTKKALCGGNLSVLQSSLGTPNTIKAKNKFILLEDVGERGYKIDKMLFQLEQAKIIKDCAGVIFGDFTGGQEPSGESYVDFAIMRFALSINKPVFKTNDFGHGKINRPILLNDQKNCMISNKELVINY